MTLFVHTALGGKRSCCRSFLIHGQTDTRMVVTPSPPCKLVDNPVGSKPIFVTQRREIMRANLPRIACVRHLLC